MRLLPTLFLLLLVCGLSMSANAASCTLLNDHELERLQTLAIESDLNNLKAISSPFTVRDIRIVLQDVFPVEGHWLARSANRFHPRTKIHVLQAALPFAVGDVIDDRILKESERILRAKPYLHDARVFVRQICDAYADVDIVVRDVWTLTPKLDFNRAGGDNEFAFGVSDSNLLGLGKEFDISYEQQDEREGINFVLSDPNILGTRWAASAIAADNDDGHRYGIDVALPFYALDSRFSTGFLLIDDKRDNGLYLLSDKIWEIGVESEDLRSFVGFSNGRKGRWVDRLIFGAAYRYEEFTYPDLFPDPGPPERKFVYPYVAWQRVEDRFVHRSNLDRIGRTEDVDLGIRSYVELGWSAESFGGIGDYLVGRAFLSGRWYLADRHLLHMALEFNGRYEIEDHFTDEAITTLAATYSWQHREQWNLVLRGNYTVVRNLPVHRQLTLGGDSGLRGYPSRYQVGDRQYLFTVEERYYTNLIPFGLFHVGWAAFVDVGRAWYKDAAPTWVPERTGDHYDTLVDVGIGLRLESIRTRGDRVVHIDIAKPLIDGPEVSSFELTLTVKRSI